MISLREYNRDIEVLIDNSQYDEAIAHCKHILGIYPKCINTYRNLGKTLLESKRYSEALDIFQRVLTAFPDDFISHVGLSIIYEDGRDLDQAIWHMELAFDVQPSNVAIQDELKRLFGRRDGAQPQKIRLSRGALVRMYARGELFQQAIAEIHSILVEDPKRIDLEVILARMLFLSGSSDDAIETCNQIISRIPFCFEANKILDSIYSKKGDSEQATIFHSRLVSLDPYYRYQTSLDIIQEIPEEKVLLEKLVYTPLAFSNTSVPEWTKTIGIQWDEDQPAENTEWLREINNQNQDSSSETVPVDNS
jgi:tetratricopeptide (TPR) repeat protein